MRIASPAEAMMCFARSENLGVKKRKVSGKATLEELKPGDLRKAEMMCTESFGRAKPQT